MRNNEDTAKTFAALLILTAIPLLWLTKSFELAATGPISALASAVTVRLMHDE